MLLRLNKTLALPALVPLKKRLDLRVEKAWTKGLEDLAVETSVGPDERVAIEVCLSNTHDHPFGAGSVED